MTTLQPPVSEVDQQTGNIESGLTLVEYGDYQCPYCLQAQPLVRRLLAEYGGELRFVFRHFPLKKIHAQAFAAAVSAEAAGRQGRFWPMHDLLFENQSRFRKERLFLDLAEELGLDLDRFILDSKSDDIAKKVETDFGSGIYSGVNRTPTFFLNEAKVSAYDGTYGSLSTSIQMAV